MKKPHLFTDSLSSVPQYYLHGRKEAALSILEQERHSILKAREESFSIANEVDDLVIYAFDRMIEFCQEESVNQDFHVFYTYMGKALQEADRELGLE